MPSITPCTRRVIHGNAVWFTRVGIIWVIGKLHSLVIVWHPNRIPVDFRLRAPITSCITPGVAQALVAKETAP